MKFVALNQLLKIAKLHFKVQVLDLETLKDFSLKGKIY